MNKDEEIAMRIEVETLRKNRDQFETHTEELKATIEKLTKTGPIVERIAEKIVPMSLDELEIVEWFLDKMNGEGRKEHGELDHDTDERSVADWAANQIDEFIDTAFYSIGKRARRSREKGRA
jgi:hypothetical protein